LAAVSRADADDPRLDLYRGVRDPELLREHGLFVAEGRLVVKRLLENPAYRVRSVLVTPAARESLGAALERADCPVYLAESASMAAISGFNIHRGCLAIAERPAALPLDELLSGPRSHPLIVLERVGNPDNVGGIFRNAGALGAAGIVLSPGCSDPLYRKSIRTSMGATLSVPYCVAARWPADLAVIVQSGRQLVTLSPAETAAPIERLANGLQQVPVALLFGHEGHGISSGAAAFASVAARIPMAPGCDSLNVAAASAIALHVFSKRSSDVEAPEP
jgi:tRNA G18 (ribose-2'-O)-methylase SpoU